jgi:glyoxylase-like metal-dependent hydrolase (beta-lactamase superfamily II)
MKSKSFEFNPLSVNTYVLSDETGECVIIDPACFYPDEKDLLLNYIFDNDLVVKHMLNTHLHFDHILGNNLIESQFGIAAEAHPDDLFLLDSLPEQLSAFGFENTDTKIPVIKTLLHHQDTIRFGNQELRVLHVPGHSPGSVVFYHASSGAVYCGDVLFNGSIGRTDLPGGNFELLIEGIQHIMFALPAETIVYPGHGPFTTIQNEKKYNPFVGIKS